VAKVGGSKLVPGEDRKNKLCPKNLVLDAQSVKKHQRIFSDANLEDKSERVMEVIWQKVKRETAPSSETAQSILACRPRNKPPSSAPALRDCNVDGVVSFSLLTLLFFGTSNVFATFSPCYS